MKISVSKRGTVTFSDMDPELAEVLVDVAKDLSSDNAVLLYGPGYEAPVALPTDRLRDKMEALLHADARYPGALMADYADKQMWRAEPLLEETHVRVWAEIEEVRRHPAITVEVD